MNLSKAVARLRDSHFVRSVGVLTGGVVLAHGVTAATMPVVTRLYSPADFNALAPFVGLISIIGTASCLRLDTAVPIPEHDEDGAHLLVMALLSTAVIAAATGAVLMFLPPAVADRLHQPVARAYPWLLALGVLLLGSYSALQSWFVRRKEFRTIAQTRLGQSCAGAGVQIGFGFAGASPLGLILGQIISSSGGALALGVRGLMAGRSAFKTLSVARMRELLSRYRRFPTYSTLESLCNTGGMQIPVILIAGLASGPEAGYLMLAMFIMQAPMALIGTSVNQVFASRAPAEFRAGRLGHFALDVYTGLLKSGAGPLMFAGIVAPAAFEIIFGREWGRAGVLVSWMTGWFVLQFLAVPISLVLHVTDHLPAALWLQAAGLLIRVIAVIGAGRFAADAVPESYALSGFVFYLLYLIVVLRVAGTRSGDVARRTISAFPVMGLWIVAGIALRALVWAVRVALT